MAKGKVLIIDDEELVCKSLGIMLQEHGYETESSLTGEEGIKVAREGDFDVVLVDLKMPDVDGIVILTRLKELVPTSEVIIITGYPSDETLAEARQIGAYDYVTKPFNIPELMLLVARAVNHRKEPRSKSEDKPGS